MNITIQIPEILLISSCVYFLNGHTALGWTTFILGLFIALVRFGVNQKADQDRVQSNAKLVNDFSNSIVGLLSTLGGSYTRNSNIN